MKKIFLTYSITVVFISLGLVNAKAQQTLKVGNNPTTVTNSAVLDVEATNKGALLPRVALTGTTDVTTIANPANALTVFNTANAGTAPNNVTPGYYFYSTSLNKWVKLVTTEEIKPNYKIVVDPINGQNHITSDAGLNSLGESLGGSENIAIGNTSMSSNAFIGSANTAVGYYAAQSLTSGTWNTLLGLASGVKVTTGEYNVVVGANAMTNVETGSRNTALGGDAMSAAGSNVNFSTAVGSGALGGVQSGDYNIGLGNNAGSALNIGSGNVYIGNEAGHPIPLGVVNESNQLYINNGPGANALIRGDFATKELTINNTLKVTGLNSAAPATTGNRPVVADANGQLKIGTDAEIITADNGLTKTGSNIQLGGALTHATTITTDATKTIALAGLQTGANTDKVVVADVNGVLKSVDQTTLEGDLRLVGNNNHITKDAGVGSNGSSSGSGVDNVGIGKGTLQSIVNGGHNIAIGQDVLKSVLNGEYNIGIGINSSYNFTIGLSNIGLGTGSLFSGTTGSSNIALGTAAGHNNVFPSNSITTGSENFVVGTQALVPDGTASHQMNIKNTIFGIGMNGTLAAPAGSIGINVSAPTNTLHVKATADPLRLEGLQTGAVTDNVVVADANGVLKSISSSNITANNWSLTGNAGTTAGTNFLGTTDSQDLIFKTNNLERLRITQTGRLDFSNTSGSNTNIFLKGGNETTTGGNNIALGTQALPSNTTGSWNIGLGTQALQANTTGFLNTALGGASMIANTTGGWNTAIGVDGLRANTTGNYNTALGYRAGRFITTGSNNITIGWDAGLPSNTADGQMNIGNIIYATGRGAVGAGNLGVGITNPGNKLEIQHGTAGNSGLRFTNLTNAPLLATNASGDVITATANPANGLFWGLTGNSGTNPTNNYIGTRDAADFVVITNNTERMRTTSAGNVAIGNQTPATVASATSGSTAAQQLARLTVSSGDISVNGVTVGKGGGQLGTNLAFGVQTLYNNTTGNENIAIGVSSLNLNSTGSNNLAIGNNALYSNTADWNFAIGNVALQSNTTGTWNQGIGAYALNRNTTGGWNVAVGATAMQYNTTGMYNVALGNSALRNGNIASRNTAIGYRTLETSNGTENTAIGNQAGSLIGTGARNTAVGDSTLLNVTTGNRNTALGDNALSNLFTGSNNIGIGASVQVPSQTASNQMNIGNTLFGTGMNGTLAAPAGFLGVNTSAPSNTLHVKATADPLRLEGLQTGASTDKVVVADANGVLKTVDKTTLAPSAIRTETANYTALAADETILVNANGGAVTITLPAANTAAGKKYAVKKIDASANGVQVISAGGTIDGNAAGTGVTGTLSWQGWVFQSDGTNWFIISRI